ncbi:hypothetical protein BPMI_03184 [Candidatus Burkholderia pumila]|uniref:KfrB domain-containing protein n=1 Tax=Candidatus Burkholderia pumila TaxID=1090375 RepID=A0ABR5HNW6_9BURK|nr:hypothetical protein BPMI_03184 [Candidatus Burkholderia pumila]
MTDQPDRLEGRGIEEQAPRGGREVKPAEAVHDKDYVGTMIRVTQWHMLQEVDEQIVLHDPQLKATSAFVEGQEQAISYRYKYGKIDPVDAPATDGTKSGPTLK